MMTKYKVIVYWSDEDEALVAEVPELPGCAADGATCSEAIDNAEVFVWEWVQTAQDLGRPIPEPQAIGSLPDPTFIAG